MKKNEVLSILINLCVGLCLVVFMAISFPTLNAAPIQPSEPRYGGLLRIADLADGLSIGYPPKLVGVYSNRQVAPAIETLFRTDKSGKVVPWLATGYNSDVAAKTITLRLRKGVKFHDGTDFNAEAVRWNLNQCMSAKTTGTDKFKSIDVIDDSTVRINLTEWDNTVTSNLAQTIGMIISPTAYKNNGEQWCANHPVGTGPFEFVNWEKDVRTTYKKFANYWQKGKPYLDRIEWTIIKDSLTRQLSLRKGELDLMIRPDAKDIPGLEKDGYAISRTKVGSGAMSLIFDSTNTKSPFADVRVRQAAQHAIDTKEIVRVIYLGEAEAANQWSYKGHWAYNPSVLGYPYNPAKAKQLLTEAGYPNGFKTTLLYRTTPQDDQTFTAVQGYLKAVGIDAQLEPLAQAKWYQICFQNGKWEGLLHSGPTTNPDTAAVLASRYSGGGPYFTQMVIPDDYAKAALSAVTAPDFETKQKWTQEIMKLMIDKYCLQMTLCSWYEAAAHGSYLHNHGLMGAPDVAWWTPEEAWIDR